MAQVALLGQAKRNDKRIRARISKTLSGHAVASTWWDPSNVPSWLAKECYVQKIQPLQDKKIREIAQTMQVSQPYAAFIRAGRCHIRDMGTRNKQGFQRV